MLPKRQRLVASEVREVLKRGRGRRGNCLSMKLISTTTPLRVSVVVPKLVAKKAVDRNRLRRAIYRALAPLSGTGLAIVFVHKVPAEPLTPAFRAELGQLLPSAVH